MGLDMYLTAEKYVSGYSDVPTRDKIMAALNDYPPLRDEGSYATVNVSVAYWRKANAIHGWFVRELQDGKDDCDKYFVPLEKLKELVATCESVLFKRDPEHAEEELPTESGFFFGSTEYDDWYWENVEATIDMLSPMIQWFEGDEKRRGDWDLFYRSSW